MRRAYRRSDFQGNRSAIGAGGDIARAGSTLSLAVPGTRHHRAQVVERLRSWQQDRGRLPFWDEWDRTAPDRPTAKTIERRWGWSELRAEAAGMPAEHFSSRAGRWDRAHIVRAMRDWTACHGRLPVTRDWERASEEHPNQRTVVRVFGGWLNALMVAFPSDELVLLELRRLCPQPHVTRGAELPRRRRRRLGPRTAPSSGPPKPSM